MEDMIFNRSRLEEIDDELSKDAHTKVATCQFEFSVPERFMSSNSELNFKLSYFEILDNVNLR